MKTGQAGRAYQWPASALTTGDMRMLHAARLRHRETKQKHVPITELLARAVRLVYGDEPQAA